MTSNGAVGGLKRRLIDTPFLIFSASTTLLTGLLVSLMWLSDKVWIAALIPIGPAVVAIAMGLLRDEKDKLKELLLSLMNGQVGGKWFAISALTLPAIAVFSILIYAITGNSDLNFGVPRVAAIFLALPLAMCNELGWRGYAPLHISDRRGLFVKSVVIGAVWLVSIAPVYLLDTPLLGDVPIYQLGLALIPLSTLMFWLIANTKSLLMPALLAASGVMTVSLLPVLPGDSAQGVTFWLVVGLLWIAAVVVVGVYGSDGLDGSIHELPPDELPVGWDKIMPRASSEKDKLSARNGRAKSRSKTFTAVGRKTRR